MRPSLAIAFAVLPPATRLDRPRPRATWLFDGRAFAGSKRNLTLAEN